jgi:hypothetical protein
MQGYGPRSTQADAVKCSMARVGTVSKPGCGGDVEVTVTAPEMVLRDMLEYLAARNHQMQGFMEKYQRRTDIVQTFQCLAFLIEHCRYTKSNRLTIVGKPPGTSTNFGEEPIRFILDLEALNGRPKKCSKTGCPSKGNINCSRCLITYWCSATCLEECYDSITHRIVCAQAEIHLKTLFPD